MAIISCTERSLPRDLDVPVSVSKTQVETTTDLSIVMAVVQDPDLRHDNDRVRYYSSLEAVEDDFAITTEAWKMASSFFSKSPRATTMAIGGAFTTAKPAFIITGALGQLSNFTAVSDASFAANIDGDPQDITAVDLTTATDYAGVAALLQTALQAIGTGGYTAATVALEGDNQFIITSGTTGDLSRITVLSSVSPATGTDISGSNYLNADAASGAVPVDGYTPTGIVGELALIAQAATCIGRFSYGWALDQNYSNVSDQDPASLWVQSRTGAMVLASNNPQAYDSAVTTDIGSVLSLRGDYRTAVIYTDNLDEYPDVGILAYLLHVNYRAEDSTVTAKFKDLNSVSTVGITETQLSALENKRYNVFTRIGNISRTFREGVQANTSWFMDDLINLDNFKEILQTEVFNLFLRTKKLTYSTNGYNLLDDTIRTVCELFVLNGTFAERRVTDSTIRAGFRIEPPFRIAITPQNLIPITDRANRIGPPVTITANLAGAIHSISITVNAQS